MIELDLPNVDFFLLLVVVLSFENDVCDRLVWHLFDHVSVRIQVVSLSLRLVVQLAQVTQVVPEPFFLSHLDVSDFLNHFVPLIGLGCSAPLQLVVALLGLPNYARKSSPHDVGVAKGTLVGRCNSVLVLRCDLVSIALPHRPTFHETLRHQLFFRR